MKVIGVIPARWASTRFEGKILAKLAGKPLIQHVWEKAKTSKKLDDVIIACDKLEVKEVIEGFGAKAVMTNDQHPSGTDRIAEAARDLDTDVVINIQGDEPLITAQIIDDLVDALARDEEVRMATVIKEIETEDELNNPNVVKVVIDDNKNALYFSRSAIPFNRDKSDVTYYKHLGIYAYTKEFLLFYSQMSKSKLEDIEKLEQLRVLEAGYKIKTVLTDIETIGVDTQEDLQRIESLL